MKFFSVILLFLGMLFLTACLTTVPELYLDPVEQKTEEDSTSDSSATEEVPSTEENATEPPLSGDSDPEASDAPVEAESVEDSNISLPSTPDSLEPRDYSLEEYEKHISSSESTATNEPVPTQTEPEIDSTKTINDDTNQGAPSHEQTPESVVNSSSDSVTDTEKEPALTMSPEKEPDSEPITESPLETSDPPADKIAEEPVSATEEPVSATGDTASDFEPEKVESLEALETPEKTASNELSSVEETEKSADIDTVPPAITVNEITEPAATENLQEKPQTISNMLIEEKKKQVNTALFVLTASVLAAAMLLTIAYSRRKNHDDNPEPHADKKRKKQVKKVDQKTREPVRQPIAVFSPSPGILSQIFLHMYAKILGLRTVKSLGSTEEFLAKSFHLDLEILNQLQMERKTLKRKVSVLEQYLAPHLRKLTQETIEKTGKLTILLLAVEGLIYKKEVDTLKLIMGLAQIEPAKIDRLLSEYSIEVTKPGFPFIPRDSVPVPLAFSNKKHVSLEGAYKQLPEMEFIDHAILTEILNLLSELTEA